MSQRELGFVASRVLSVYLLVRVIFGCADLTALFLEGFEALSAPFWAGFAAYGAVGVVSICLWIFASKFGGKNANALGTEMAGPLEVQRVALLILGIYFAVAGFSGLLNDFGVAYLAKQVPERLRVGRSIPFAGDGFQAIAGIVICAISRAKKPLR